MELNRRTELIGRRFGKLVVVGPGPVKTKVRRTHWICHCDCGNEVNIREAQLLDCSALSCGCLIGQHFKTAASREVAMLRDKWGKAKVWRFYQYKHNAQARGYAFELTEVEFENLTQQSCHYCGIPPSNIASVPTRAKGTSRSEPIRYTGLDRVDNSRGYSIDNVVPCCADCNRAKRTMGYQQFLDWVARVYHYRVEPTSVPQLQLAA